MNQGNIRSVKAVASTNILMNWNKGDNHDPAQQIATGITNGWYATATVNEHGDISDLAIFVAKEKPSDGDLNSCSGISNKDDVISDTEPAKLSTTDGVTGTLKEKLEGVGFVNGVYYVQVYLKDIDYTASDFDGT